MWRDLELVLAILLASSLQAELVLPINRKQQSRKRQPEGTADKELKTFSYALSETPYGTPDLAASWF